MSLSKLDNTCTCMYLSRLNAIVGIPEEVERLKKAISSSIANDRMWALVATVTARDQRKLLEKLGFKLMTAYVSYDHYRDVFLYIRKTSKKEFLARKAYFKRTLKK